MSKFPDKIYLSIIPEQSGDRENDIYEEWSLAPIKGAENQEYLALTWEDMKQIDLCFHSVATEHTEGKLKLFSFQQMYEEVLRRFREMKNK